MTTITLAPEQKKQLNTVFSRSYYSASGYVFESRPYIEAADVSLLDDLKGLRLDDRKHAMLIAELIESYDEVPEPGVFAYWHRDLNYLTVPYLMGFVVEEEAMDLTVLADKYTMATVMEERLKMSGLGGR